MSSAALVNWFQVFALAGFALTVVKLYKTKLYTRYRKFFLLFLFQIPNSIWPLLIDTSSPLYAYFWAATEPFIWALYWMVVLELYELVLANHRGLYSLGRWILYGAMAISVFISILSLLPHLTQAIPQSSRWLGYFFATERGVYSTLAIFIFLILLFLSQYPVRLSRNVLVHTVLYSAYFLSGTLATLLHSVFGHRLSTEVNLFVTGVTTVCTFLWFILLTPKGEEVQTSMPLFGPEHEKRALRQLDDLNATLLKAGRD